LGRWLPLGIIAAIVVQLYRFPGVPLWDLPGLTTALEAERTEEPVWIDPRLGRLWDRYGRDIDASRGTWNQASAPVERPLWVVAPDHHADELPGHIAKQLQAEGVKATLWISD
jgi:hypothetical protein